MKSRRFRLSILVFAILATMVVATSCGNTEKSNEETTKAKVEIGISYSEDINAKEYSEDLQAYIDAVKAGGGDPVLLPQIKTEADAEKALKTVGAVIVTGGEDIDPSYYKEKPHPKLEELNKARDLSDYTLLKAALKADMPVLATCRGFQMLNIVNGGTLYQDLPTEKKDSKIVHRDPKLVDFTYHNIKIEKDSKVYDLLKTDTMKVNSWHHQAVKKLGKGLTVTARADDGIIEAVQMDSKTYVVGVQFHPEWHVVDGDKEFLPFFTKLVDLAQE